MTKPHTLTATYRIVTPMFIGGANHEADSIRPPSIKGALRFWWRALNWAHIRNNTASDEEGLINLHMEEERLFGSTYSNEKNLSGQGVFLLNIKLENPLKITTSTDLDKNALFKLNSNKWQSYLLGLGLMKSNNEKKVNEYKRSAIINGAFSVRLTFKPNNRDREKLERDIFSIEKSLLIFGLLGGLGSRNRRGLGSVSITNLEGSTLQVPRNISDYIDTLQSIINSSGQATPPITTFSNKSQIKYHSSKDSPWHALGNLAKEFQLFRGWGYKPNENTPHKINNIAAEHNAEWKKEDHIRLYKIVDSENAHDNTILPPNNVIFGLPRSYKTAKGKFNDIKIEPKDKDNGISRRASPLFFHVHQSTETSEVTLVQIYLPSTFLPSNLGVDLKQKKNGKYKTLCSSDFSDDFSNYPNPIELFLQRKCFSNWTKVNIS